MCMQKFSHKQFRFGVPASYAGHVVTACCFIVHICHGVKVKERCELLTAVVNTTINGVSRVWLLQVCIKWAALSHLIRQAMKQRLWRKNKSYKIKNTQNFKSFVRLFTGDWGRILISSITGMKILPGIK